MKTKKRGLITKIIIAILVVAIIFVIGLVGIYSYSSSIEESLADINSSFSITLKNGSETITVNSWECDKNNKSYLFLPAGADTSEVKIECDGAKKLSIDGQDVQLGEKTDLLDGLESCNIELDGKKYDTVIMHGSNVPTIHIQTESGSLETIYADKSNKESASINIFENSKLIVSSDLKYIKGRGNISFEQPQKSFNIKFDKKIDLFGMGEAKKYALVTTYTDQTLLKDNVAYSLADEVGLDYTSKYQQIDLYINNNYLGCYLLVENVEVGENRVNINDLDKANEDANKDVNLEDLDIKTTSGDVKDTQAGTKKWVEINNEPENISSGYLLEIEAHNRFIDEPSGFVSDYGQAIVLKSPEYATYNEVMYISEFYQDFENALYSPDGTNDKGKHYTDYIDIESFASLYILEELAENRDANASSTYMYLDESGVLKAGPAWDFENGFGTQRKVGNIHTDEPANPEYWEVCAGGFFSKLCLHSDFRQEVSRIWNNGFRDKAIEMEGLIDEQSSLVLESAIMNGIRWNRFSETEYANVKDAFNGKINELKQYVNSRIDFFDSHFTDSTSLIIYNSNGEETRLRLAYYYNSGEEATILENPYVSNKEFLGWNTSPNGDGTSYKAGDVITPDNEGVVLYAQWGDTKAGLSVKKSTEDIYNKIVGSFKYRIQVITD